MNLPTVLKVVEVASATDIGRVRDHNEDRALATPSLLAVADGMGGAQAGEVAAQIAIDHLDRLGKPADGAAVVEAIEEANEAIIEASASDPDKSGMGTTITAISPQDGHLRVAHVGDSRAYLWRDEALRQLTSDHSVVAELVRQGKITAEEAEDHPHRNVITRALGADARVAVDSGDQAGRDGDIVLICSDGLSAQVSDEAIAAVMRSEDDLQSVARILVEQANAAGGIDNVTVVLARLEMTEGEALASTTAELPAAGADKPRSRPRLSPVALSIAVLLALAIGGTAWLWSRAFMVQDGDGQVVVKRGIPLSVGGIPPRVTWQETGVDAARVNAVEPASLSDSARGRGEAVLLATRLAWQYGIGEAPIIPEPPRVDPAPVPPPDQAP
ncbi:MAG: Stp1/IreP family PP2C-type Ser/Thr phosphatase [Thermoleophilia bacterium]|nr:Stp1/IreP family PP2C-type Ser/Thr phosphatase [Thermoleophilia bacterium]